MGGDFTQATCECLIGVQRYQITHKYANKDLCLEAWKTFCTEQISLSASWFTKLSELNENNMDEHKIYVNKTSQRLTHGAGSILHLAGGTVTAFTTTTAVSVL